MPDRWPLGNGSRVGLVQWKHRRHWANEGTFPRASQAIDTRDLKTVSSSLCIIIERRCVY